MVKIFLVEDEVVVREGIKNNIDWSAHGYEFCGEASDGELALPMIQKIRPDIVITDIKMPFMDGLELSRIIKKEFPEIEIIVLSGYEEFKYAKEGIKIGIAQYLTKPISGEELLKEVEALALKIEEKRKESEISKKYKRELEEYFFQEKRNLFQYLVTGSKSVSELLNMANELNIDISSIWYNIVLLKVESGIENLESKSLTEIEQKLQEMDEKNEVVLFDRDIEGVAFLFKSDSVEELESLQTTFLQSIKESLDGVSDVRYFGGIGKPVNRLGELAVSFKKASLAFAHRYLMNGSAILSSEDLEQGNYMKAEDFGISEVDVKSINRERVKEFLKLGEQNEAEYFVEELFNKFSASAVNSNLFRQYLTIDISLCVAEFLEELQVPKEEVEELRVTAGAFQNVENTIQYVIHILEKALELRGELANNRYDILVEQVKQYIEENYADEDFSLNLLASKVNFSANHISKIFSRQTGHTFVKYLTDYRMNKAKELLRCTGKRSSEVSIEVGYKDPHYFSYLFKKTQGMTPTQYRVGNVSKGESD